MINEKNESSESSLQKNDSSNSINSSIHKTNSIYDYSIAKLNDECQSYLTPRIGSIERRHARCTTLMTSAEISFLSKSISKHRKKKNAVFEKERDKLLSQIKKKRVKPTNTTSFFNIFWNVINPFSLLKSPCPGKLFCE